MRLLMVLVATVGLTVPPMFAGEAPFSAASPAMSLDTGRHNILSVEHVPFINCHYTICDWSEGVKLRTDKFKGLCVLIR